MRVVCPSCTATYEVPAPLLGSAPRRLRCARCQREWTVEGATQAVAAARAERPAPAQIGPAQGGPAETGREQAGREQPGPMARLLDGGAAVDHTVRNAPAKTAERSSARVDDDPFALEPAIRERLDSAARADPSPAPPPLPTPRGRPIPPARPREGLLFAEQRPRKISDTGARGRTAGVALAWLLSVAVLCVCIGAAFVWRADVIRLWPPSERVYLALGLR